MERRLLGEVRLVVEGRVQMMDRVHPSLFLAPTSVSVSSSFSLSKLIFSPSFGHILNIARTPTFRLFSLSYSVSHQPFVFSVGSLYSSSSSPLILSPSFSLHTAFHRPVVSSIRISFCLIRSTGLHSHAVSCTLCLIRFQIRNNHSKGMKKNRYSDSFPNM